MKIKVTAQAYDRYSRVSFGDVRVTTGGLLIIHPVPFACPSGYVAVRKGSKFTKPKFEFSPKS